MHVRPFLSTCDIPNRLEKLLDLCVTLPDVFGSLPNSFESLPSWDVDSPGCIWDTPFSFETLTDLFITLPYYFEKLPVWFERICDIFQILLLSLWHFLSCLKHILTWWVSSCPLEMYLLCLKHLQSWGSSWLTFSDLPKTLHDMFETCIYFFIWHSSWQVWDISWPFSTIGDCCSQSEAFTYLKHFLTTLKVFLVCLRWFVMVETLSLIVTLCVWKGEKLLKHISKHVWKGKTCLKHFLTVWDPS